MITAKAFDLITIGDSTIDTFIKIHDATVECDINRQDCKICISYGAKIPVDSIAHGPAGNAANVAVAAAKLGLKCAIYTNLGDDEHGISIKNALEKAGINQDYIFVHVDKSSNISVVLTFQGERTIFIYHQDWYYRLPKLKPTAWLYLTSMAETFTNSNIMSEVAGYIQKSGAKLVFAPGTYQLKADIKRFRQILEKCQLLIVNKEEAKQILNIEKSERPNPRDMLSKILLLGPKIAVITDGAEGSYAADSQNYLKIGIFPTKVIEKTGAGDAYASAFICGLIKGLALGEAMAWGTINASHVIQGIGPQNGLMDQNEIREHQKEIKNLLAVPI